MRSQNVILQCKVHLQLISSRIIYGNSKLIPGGYAPVMYKTYFKKLKKLGKKTHVEGLCAHVKFHIKPTFFVPCAKKTKKMSREIDYFSTKICLFYAGHKTCQFLPKQLVKICTRHFFVFF
jgi:hypothetical protein